MRKSMLRLLLAAGLAAAAGLVAWRGAMQHADRQAMAILSELNGGPVEAGSVTLGFDMVHLRDVRFLEQGPDAPAWVTFREIDVDLSLWTALVSEPDPDAIRMRGVELKLRFDEQGRWLNRVAASDGVDMPADRVEIDDAQLQITQQGRGTLQASGIQLVLTGPRDAVHVVGSIGQLWDRPWQIEATVDARTFAGTVRVESQEIEWSLARLASLPLIPEWDLEGVSAGGTASLTLRGSRSSEGDLDYDALVSVSNGQAEWTRTALKLEELAATLRIRPDRLVVEQLRGTLAGGVVQTQGALQIVDSGLSGHLNLDVQRVQVTEVLQAAGVSEDAAGRISVAGGFNVQVGRERFAMQGEARGDLADASFQQLELGPVACTLKLDQAEFPFAEQSLHLNGELQATFSQREFALDELRRLAARYLDQVPQTAGGRLQAEGHIQIPLDRWQDWRSYRAAGKALLLDAEVEGIRVERLHSAVQIERGTIEFPELQGRVAEGRVAGSGRLEMQPRPELLVQVEFDELRSAALSERFGAARRVEGNFRGSATLQIPLQETAVSWRGSARAESAAVRVEGAVIEQVTATAELQGSMAEVRLKGLWRDVMMAADAEIALTDGYSFTAALRSEPLPVERAWTIWNERSSTPDELPIEGRAELEGKVAGTLEPLDWSAEGLVRLVDARVRDLHWDMLTARWTATPGQIQASLEPTPLWGGVVSLSVDAIPETRDWSVAGKIQGIDAQQLQKLIAVRWPAAAQLTISGAMHGEIAARQTAEESAAELHLEHADLVLDQLSVPQLTIHAQYGRQQLKLRAVAVTAGGQIRYEGARVVSDWKSLVRRPWVEGELELEDLRIAELLRLRKLASLLPDARMDGILEGMLQVVSTGEQPEVLGRLLVRDYSWNEAVVTTRAGAELKVTPQLLHISQITARVGSAAVSGHLEYPLVANRAGTMLINVRQLSARDIGRLWPELAGNLDGRVDLRVEGRLDAQWSGQARIALVGGKLYQVPVEIPRADFRWRFNPGSGQAYISLRRTTVTVAGGRVLPRVEVSWNRGFRVDARARLVDVDIAPLMQGAGRLVPGHRGRISGELLLSGDRVLDLNDLRGSFEGNIEDAPALQLPVLSTANRFLQSGQLANRPFRSDQVEARLANGVVHLEQLALAGDNARIYVDGRVSLRGKLDLNVVAQTGELQDAAVPRLLQTSLLLANPAPLTVLSQANELLADRVVYVHITGTVRNPRPQLQPAPLLRERVIRFLLNQPLRAAGMP